MWMPGVRIWSFCPSALKGEETFHNFEFVSGRGDRNIDAGCLSLPPRSKTNVFIIQRRFGRFMFRWWGGWRKSNIAILSRTPWNSNPNYNSTFREKKKIKEFVATKCWFISPLRLLIVTFRLKFDNHKVIYKKNLPQTGDFRINHLACFVGTHTGWHRKFPILNWPLALWPFRNRTLDSIKQSLALTVVTEFYFN